MMMLRFYVGKSAFVVSANEVQEVFPKVELTQIASAPDYVLGILNYAGEPVIVIDFCQLIDQRPSKEALHSRIMLCSGSLDHKKLLVGVLAENVTEVLDIPSRVFKKEVKDHNYPYLSKGYSDDDQLLQRLYVNELILWNRSMLQSCLKKVKSE